MQTVHSTLSLPEIGGAGAERKDLGFIINCRDEVIDCVKHGEVLTVFKEDNILTIKVRLNQ